MHGLGYADLINPFDPANVDNVDLSLFEETTWHVPAVLGLTAGALGAWYMFSRKQGSFAGLGSYSRSSNRGKHCVRFKRTRAGRRCAKYSR
ncbi:MAG: hypothetical protein ACYS7M_16155 [Planctomycetota bacterium]|jgi:hypothetical protein